MKLEIKQRMPMEKQLIIKIKELQPGRFFIQPYVIINVVKSEKGKESDFGDYLISSEDGVRNFRRLKEEWEQEYELIGDWNI